MRDAVEEGPDIKVQHPVLLPAAPSSHGEGVVGRTPRTVTVAVRVEDRLQLLFKQHRRRCLSDSVGHIGDGYSILLLLQSRVGMVGRVWSCVGRVGLWWTWCPRAPTRWRWSGPGAGYGAQGCRVEVPGLGYTATAFGLDTVGPGDAEPVAGAAPGGEFAGLDPVVDHADAGAETCGGLGDADLAVGVGVGGGDVVGMADPLHGLDVERRSGAGGEPGGVEQFGELGGLGGWAQAGGQPPPRGRASLWGIPGDE